MSNKSNEKAIMSKIKKEDRKAKKWFYLLLVVSFVIGGCGGTLIARMGDNLASVFNQHILPALERVVPFAGNVITFLIMIVVIVLYQKAQAMYRDWDEEDEDILDAIELKLDYALWLVAISNILCYMFFGLGFLVIIKGDFHGLLATCMVISMFATIVYGLVFTTIAQQKIVNFEKLLNPEKSGSIYDRKFADKWVDSCDELERLTIYKCAYKSYKITNMSCAILWLISILLIPIFNVGVFPLLFITAMWLILTSSYCAEAIHLHKHPEEIRKIQGE